jgi:hypothetical protein
MMEMIFARAKTGKDVSTSFTTTPKIAKPVPLTSMARIARISK